VLFLLVMIIHYPQSQTETEDTKPDDEFVVRIVKKKDINKE
jgi:hypothetical protein